MAAQYLVLQDKALEAQNTVSKRKFGLEVYNDESGEYYAPWATREVFQVIHHPTTKFSAIVIPDNIPCGMRDGEDWTRGKERTVNEETVKGRPHQSETINNLWPTNRPLKDEQYMIDKGWFEGDQ